MNISYICILVFSILIWRNVYKNIKELNVRWKLYFWFELVDIYKWKILNIYINGYIIE